MTDQDYPSVELLAVEWVRQNAPLVALLGANPDTRCATRLPADPTFPFLVVFEVDSGPLHVSAEVVSGLLQFDAYADKGDYDAAEGLALTLIAECGKVTGYTSGSEGTIQGLNFRTKRRIDEPDTLWARYMVEIQMLARV